MAKRALSRSGHRGTFGLGALRAGAGQGGAARRAGWAVLIATVGALVCTGLVSQAGGLVAQAGALASPPQTARPGQPVPWGDVGPGWLISKWVPQAPTIPGEPSPSPTVTTGQWPGGASATLYLISPTGRRYVVGHGRSLPQGDLVSWSSDGAHVLFEAASQAGTVELTVFDLRTGAAKSLYVAGFARPAAFLDGGPEGPSLVVDAQATTEGTIPMQRFSLLGRHEVSFATRFSGSGTTQGGGFLLTPNTGDMLVATSTGFELVNLAGRGLLPLPMTATAGNCQPERWWQPDVALASCVDGSGVPSLWLVPLDGAAPSRLTAPPPPRSPDAGDVDAWKLPSGTYVQDLGGCGYEYLARLGAGGTTAPVAVPGTVRGRSVSILGAYGSRLSFIATSPCTGGGFLAWFNPVTKEVTQVLGGTVNGGAVEEALLYGEQPTWAV